jgi:cell division protein ZapA (FtsZ GTPase activity inhibitor)
MSHINVTINARQYRMACEEGQEVRLLKLAESLESRIQSLRGKFGEIGDARLVVMAALTVCDELLDTGPRIRQHCCGRTRPRHPGRGGQCAQLRRRPHRTHHAGAEPYHRRRRRDRVTHCWTASRLGRITIAHRGRMVLPATRSIVRRRAKTRSLP